MVTIQQMGRENGKKLITILFIAASICSALLFSLFANTSFAYADEQKEDQAAVILEEQVALSDEESEAMTTTEEIADEETPLGVFDSHPDCWVHWFMIGGIALTVIYVGGVLFHRKKESDDLDNFRKELVGDIEQQEASFQSTGSRVYGL